MSLDTFLVTKFLYCDIRYAVLCNKKKDVQSRTSGLKKNSFKALLL